MERQYDLMFKLLLIGDSSVGKSCILLKFADDCFNSTFITTVGVDFKIRTIVIEGTKIKLKIWDSAGQERFRTVIKAFFRGAKGIMLVYDVTNKTSFENISTWIKSINENVTGDMEKMILGNKCDLEHLRVISMERGRRLAKEHGMKFMETSAKTGYNIEDLWSVPHPRALKAFITLATDIKHKMESKPDESEFEITDTSVVNLKLDGPKKVGRCC